MAKKDGSSEKVSLIDTSSKIKKINRTDAKIEDLDELISDLRFHLESVSKKKTRKSVASKHLILELMKEVSETRDDMILAGHRRAWRPDEDVDSIKERRKGAQARERIKPKEMLEFYRTLVEFDESQKKTEPEANDF